MKKQEIKSEEIPYGILARFGLTSNMIDDLPKSVLDDIQEGKASPVLPISVKDDNGERIRSHTRLTLIRQEDGNVDVLFYPCLEKAPLEEFGLEQQKSILSGGNAVLVDMKPDGGERGKYFVQIDSETNQVMYSPAQVIERNLQFLSKELHLNNTEVRMMQNGEPVTLLLDDESVTMGIDLNDDKGIRIEEGDAQLWRQRAKRDWDKYTFGIYGCWVMDEQGNLDYVPEEQYTEEIWNEQKNRGLLKAASLHK